MGRKGYAGKIENEKRLNWNYKTLREQIENISIWNRNPNPVRPRSSIHIQNKTLEFFRERDHPQSNQFLSQVRLSQRRFSFSFTIFQYLFCVFSEVFHLWLFRIPRFFYSLIFFWFSFVWLLRKLREKEIRRKVKTFYFYFAWVAEKNCKMIHSVA